jgi:hypothetical protein
VLNIAMAGQYKELGRLHQEGELVEVEPSMFEDTGDVNIDLLLKVVGVINDTKASIRNLNALD